MVRSESQIIEELKEYFEYKEGILYWKKEPNPNKFGKKVLGQKAGVKQPDKRIRITLFGEKWLAHRIIFALHNNYIPYLVDHIDRNPENNLVENLRAANNTINTVNSNLSKNSTTGIKGVSLTASGKKYRAHIKIESKQLFLGSFTTIEDATTARQEAEKLHWPNIRTA